MDGFDPTDVLQYLIDAVSTSRWAEVILLVVVLITLLGGGFLIYKRMGSTERLMMRMLDMLAPGLRNRASKVEDADEDFKSRD